MNLDAYEFLKVGRIVSYDEEEQTATVKICNDRTFSNSQGTGQQITPTLLYQVPVYTSGGGGWHLTFPIKAGDTCLLSFSESGYDHWFVDNEDSAGVRDDGEPQHWTERRFSLDDGFAQVGWNNLPTAVASYHADHSQWRNANASQVISLNDDGTITLTSPIKVTIDSPEVEVTGNLLVQGNITGKAAAIITGAISAASAALVGALASASAAIGGISMTSHTHTHGGDAGTTSGPS